MLYLGGSIGFVLAWLTIVSLACCVEGDREKPQEEQAGVAKTTDAAFAPVPQSDDCITFTVHPDSHQVRTYWLGANDKPMRHFNALEGYAMKSQENLVFAMNGGMFEEDYSPVGLYVERGSMHKALDTTRGTGNFYLRPNGVFWIDTLGRGHVTETQAFHVGEAVEFATQSGPMLVVDSVIHSAFRQNSTNVHIRNGVGILPDGRVHLAMSRRPVNFYAFAGYFRSLGCSNALYLDGGVSQVYDLRSGERGADGRFGVLIGVTVPWDD